jgi:hypothetical protein
VEVALSRLRDRQTRSPGRSASAVAPISSTSHSLARDISPRFFRRWSGFVNRALRRRDLIPKAPWFVTENALWKWNGDSGAFSGSPEQFLGDVDSRDLVVPALVAVE